VSYIGLIVSYIGLIVLCKIHINVAYKCSRSQSRLHYDWFLSAFTLSRKSLSFYFMCHFLLTMCCKMSLDTAILPVLFLYIEMSEKCFDIFHFSSLLLLSLLHTAWSNLLAIHFVNSHVLVTCDGPIVTFVIVRRKSVWKAGTFVKLEPWSAGCQIRFYVDYGKPASYISVV